MNHLVINGDIVSSRKNFNPDVWQKFNENIEALNQENPECFRVPFSIYAGDGFGCVPRDLGSAIRLVLSLQEKLQDLEFRLILNEGIIEFGLEKGLFPELQGPALWENNQLLSALKKNGMRFNCVLKSIENQKTLNSALRLNLAYRANWSSNQWLLYRGIKSGWKQKEIAAELEVSQQYISKLMQQMQLDSLIAAEQNLLSLFENEPH